MENPKVDLTSLLQEIDIAESQCISTLKKLRRQRLELTGEDIVELTVSTIHKERIGLILDKIAKVDNEKSYDDLKEEWRKTAEATTNGWFGNITASGPKERLLSVMHKIAKQGGTVIIDPVHKSDIHAPNKWWDYQLEAEMDTQREAGKSGN